MIDYKKPEGPWYRHFTFWSTNAIKYIDACLNITKDAQHHNELKAFTEFNSYRLIFESNLIERVGLPAGETKRIAQNYFPKIPDNYNDLKILSDMEKNYIGYLLGSNKIKEMNAIVEKIKSSQKEIIPSISFSGKSRDFREVIQHFIGFLRALSMVFEYKITRMDIVIKRLEEFHSSSNYEGGGITEKDFRTIWIQSIEGQEFLTEEKIKILHKDLSEALLPKDAMVRPGEYRIDNRTVGDFEVFFPSPELVPLSMKKFIIKSHDLFISAWKNNENIFRIVAKITHNFVKIHPFPDFNGRVSRLIVMMILMAYGIPFPVTLRGNKKERSRYISSLKKANKAFIEPYAALIAMRVYETFKEIDSNIIGANLPSILTFKDASRGIQLIRPWHHARDRKYIVKLVQ